MKINFGWKKNAGLIYLVYRDYHIHLLVRPSHWVLGRSTDEYDRCLEYFGLGPLLFVCWEPQ